MREAERLCHELASEQYGLVSWNQALELGMSGPAVGRRVASGRWHRPLNRVLRIGPQTESWRSRLMAACLGLRAVASHRSASALHGFAGFPPREIEVMTASSFRCVPAGTIVHRTGHLPDADVVVVRGILATSPARTFVELGSVAGPERVEAALDEALRTNLVTLPQLHRQLIACGRRGRPGTATLRRLLGPRGPGDEVPESELEKSLLRLLRSQGFPEPATQFEVWDDHLFVGRLDVAYPAGRVAVEADGYAFHSARPDWLLDRRRQNALVALGWRLLRFTWEDEARPRAFLSDLGRLIATPVRRPTQPIHSLPPYPFTGRQRETDLGDFRDAPAPGGNL